MYVSRQLLKDIFSFYFSCTHFRDCCQSWTIKASRQKPLTLPWSENVIPFIANIPTMRLLSCHILPLQFGIMLALLVAVNDEILTICHTSLVSWYSHVLVLVFGYKCKWKDFWGLQVVQVVMGWVIMKL